MSAHTKCTDLETKGMNAKICGNAFYVTTRAFVKVKNTATNFANNSQKIQMTANVQNSGHTISGKKNVENNSKKNSEQGTIHVNVVWQHPTQQNRVPGSL